MRRISTIGALAAALALIPSVMRADQNTANTGASKNTRAAAVTVDAETTKVLVDLHRTNLTEIEMGQLAQDKGQSSAVKTYGETLVNDHKKAEDRVEELADQAGVKLPDKDELLASHEHGKMDELKNLKGAAFDAAFSKQMAEGHQQAIAKLEAAQSKLTGPTAQLVTELLPVLRKHHQTAQQLASKPGSTSNQTTR